MQNAELIQMQNAKCKIDTNAECRMQNAELIHTNYLFVCLQIDTKMLMISSTSFSMLTKDSLEI